MCRNVSAPGINIRVLTAFPASGVGMNAAMSVKGKHRKQRKKQRLDLEIQNNYRRLGE